MISSFECKIQQAEYYALGIDPGSSLRRATAAMAICVALVALDCAINSYERIVETEQTEQSTTRERRGR